MDKKTNRGFIITWLAIMAAGTALMFIGITHESLWYDESYTAALMNHSLGDIIRITGADSHPPLYYLILRVLTAVFGRSVLVLRAFSVLGTVGLAALGAGPVRRAFNQRTGLVYTFLVFALPITMSMAQEARMYSWAACLVTASALYGYLAQKEGKAKDWVLFGLITLFAAYTHYYALLAEIVIFGLMLIMMLVAKKKMTPFAITAGGVALGYLPWMFKLAGQVNRVSNRFWIPPVTGEVIKKTLIFPFSNKFSYYWKPLYVDIAFYIAAALIVFGLVYNIIKKKETVKMTGFALSVYALTILAGVAASFIIRPVFVERYMMPVFGLFIIGLAYGISSMGKRVLPIIGCLIILGFAIPQIQYNATERFNGPMTEAVEAMAPMVGEDDVFLHVDEHTFGTFCYYFPNNKQYFYQKKGTGGYSNYDAFQPIGQVIESPDEMPEGIRVWELQRQGGGDTSSIFKWLSAGQLIRDGKKMVFRVNPGWYMFEVHPMRR